MVVAQLAGFLGGGDERLVPELAEVDVIAGGERVGGGGFASSDGLAGGRAMITTSMPLWCRYSDVKVASMSFVPDRGR